MKGINRKSIHIHVMLYGYQISKKKQVYSCILLIKPIWSLLYWKMILDFGYQKMC